MNKTFVSIHAIIDTLGTIRPIKIIFDNATYDIDRILDVRTAPDGDTGGFGTRYTVRIGNNTTYLWLDRGRFYVNSKE